MTASRTDAVRSPRQVEALSSAVRQEIVDALVSAGPSSIAELGELLGRAPDSLYYHVRRLVKVRLLESCGSESTGGRSTQLYRCTMDQPRIRPEGPAQKSARSLGRVIQSFLRLTERNVKQALARPWKSAKDRGEHMFGGRLTGWLTRSEVRELQKQCDLIQRRLRQSRRRRSRGNLYAVTLVVCPLKPNSRSKKSED